MLAFTLIGPRLALRLAARAVLMVPAVASQWEQAKAGASMSEEKWQEIREAMLEQGASVLAQTDDRALTVLRATMWSEDIAA